MRSFAQTPGAIGYSMRAKLISRRFWTLSVWDNDKALMEFVRESSARRSDEQDRAVHGQNKFLALEAAELGNSSTLGRRDAARVRERLARNLRSVFEEES